MTSGPEAFSFRGYGRRMSSVHRRALCAAVAATSLAALLSSCSSAGPMPPAKLPPLEQLRAARYLLLGEVHDNAAVHRARADLLRQVLADGKSTRVVFEQMPRGGDAAIAAAPRDAESVATAGGLERRSWQWPLHKPVIEAALAAGATIAGGNLARDETRSVARMGADAAPADVRTALAADRAWDESQEQTQRRSIAEGHCGAMPERMLGPMVLAQRAVDAALALSMMAGPAERAVLIAGNGHVRRDVGVPHALVAAGAKPEEIVSLGFVEEGDPDRAHYDAVQVFKPAEREDPCLEFKKR